MPLPKPRYPVPQPGWLQGCAEYYALTDPAGTTFLNAVAPARPIAVQGTPNRVLGPYGRELSNLSVTNYLVKPHEGQFGSVYPFWMAALVRITFNQDQFFFTAARTTSPNQTIGIRSPNSTQVAWLVRDNATSTGNGALAPATVPNLIDGRHHVIFGVSYAPNDHRLFFDGSQIAASTTSVGALTTDTLSVGALVRNGGVFTSASGAIITLVAGGYGAAPSPQRLSRTWLTGRFQDIRPSSTALAYTPPASFNPAWVLAAQPRLLGTGVY